jgi:hypothetical protein
MTESDERIGDGRPLRRRVEPPPGANLPRTRAVWAVRATALVLVTAVTLAPVCRSGVSQTDLDKLRAEIDARIGDAAAEDVRFCRTIAFGAKPCGGPWEFLVYSTQRTDSASLAVRVERYNLLESRLNTEEGRVSDCSIPSEPAVHLVDGGCKADSG